MTTKDYSFYRHEYTFSELNKKDTPDNPFNLFQQWLNLAIEKSGPEPFAMNLATTSLDGKPSSRIVLLRKLTETGVIFYTNYSSRKGKEIENHPYGALTFFWPILERQVRMEGKMKKISSTASDEYFKTRPFETQLSTLISEQSQIISSRSQLELAYKEEEKKQAGKEIKRPTNWGGYLFIPTHIEFWQGRKNRLNDRILYTLEKNNWRKRRLAP